MSHSSWISRATVAATCVLGTSSQLSAVEAGPIAIHGAVSATAAYSDKYDFYGSTGESIDINNLELTLNGAHQFANGVRLSAQLYAYELGDSSALTLDFASLDYAFNEKIGVRVGRNKQPNGLYGDSQDLDFVRPFVFLPLGIYGKDQRALTAAFDGATLYGTLDFAAAGSVDYQLTAGWTTSVSENDPFISSMEEGSPSSTTSMNNGESSTAWLAWSTPVDGLRLGGSASLVRSLKMEGVMRTAAELATVPSDLRAFPSAFPPGMWDMAVAGQPTTIDMDMLRSFFFAEYTRGDWQFIAEYTQMQMEMTSVMPLFGASTMKMRSDGYYGMVTWQATPRVQLGAYYAENFANKYDREGRMNVIAPDHRAWTKDLAVSASFAATDWLQLKAEVHTINGTQLLAGRGNPDVTTWERDWMYFAVKSTISF